MQSITALTTGSTSGIGLGIAEALAGKGMRIVLNGLGDPDEIESLRADLAARYDTPVHFCGADMTNPDAIALMVRDAERQFGHIDVLVNNAGIQYVAPVETFPVEKWDQIIAVNLSSAFHTSRLWCSPA